MRHALAAAFASLLFGCSSAVLSAEEDGDASDAAPVVAADAGACHFGAPVGIDRENDCVVDTADDCGCPDLHAYRCKDPGYVSTNLVHGAFAGPGGSLCASDVVCVRADRYNDACADGGGGEAYSCPILPDGSTPPISLGHPGRRAGIPTPDGEGVIVCPQ